MVDPTALHLPRDFEADIATVRTELASMSRRCSGQLHLALEAFWTGSKEKMTEVESSDNVVDRAEKSIDALLLRVLALRQPVASDLRMLTACFKLVTDLERIGDEAVNIARATASSAPDDEPVRARLRRMAEATEEMLVSAVRSFSDRDERAAEGVHRAGAAIEALYLEILKDSVVFMSRHPTEIAPTMSSVGVAKCLQRIAEHAVNIADGALFVVQGEPMPR
jgi:phosphate transport system protein